MNDPKAAQERAEAKSKKAEGKAQEAERGWSAYQAQAKAEGEKTTRLRALRLTKEAADKVLADEAAAAKAAEPPKKKRASKRA